MVEPGVFRAANAVLDPDLRAVACVAVGWSYQMLSSVTRWEPGLMGIDEELGNRERLLARTAAARAQGRRIAARVSQLAGEIAKTEDRVAAQRERLAAAQPDRAHELRRSAEDARSFAEHERREQERWSDTAQNGD